MAQVSSGRMSAMAYISPSPSSPHLFLTLKVLVTTIDALEHLWNRILTAQWEGMRDVGAARYEPALLPPCPTIKVLSYSSFRGPPTQAAGPSSLSVKGPPNVGHIFTPWPLTMFRGTSSWLIGAKTANCISRYFNNWWRELVWLHSFSNENIHKMDGQTSQRMLKQLLNEMHALPLPHWALLQFKLLKETSIKT